MTKNEEPGPAVDAITACAGELAFVVDGDLTITYASERFWTATGLSQEDVLDADLGALEGVVVEGLVQLRTTVAAVVDGRASFERVDLDLVDREDRDSGARPAETRVSPVVDEGTVRGALVLVEYDDETRWKQDLAETYQRYETLVEQSKDGVTITQNRKNVFVNDGFAEMVGYPKEQLVGASFLKPIAPTDHEKVERRYRRRLHGEQPPSRYELGLVTNDADRLIVEVNVNRIQYAGKPATMATYRNITERKEREEELVQFRRAIETAPHAIYFTDADGTISYVNPAFEEITEYSPSEALGRTPAILNSGKNPETVYETLWETISSGSVWEGTLINQRASGTLYHTHETIAPITDADGSVQTYVAIQTDITEHVERERLVDSLDRVLRHNLRNRLNVIEGHSELIRTKADEDLAEHVEEIVESVNDLLETTRKGREIIKFLSGRTRKQPIDAVAIVDDVVSAHRSRYPGARITIDRPATAMIEAVPELEDAIAELVNNAIKHNDNHVPEVSVSVAAGEETVTVRIADNGPGISKMERQAVTETTDVNQLYHASGFGLWLIYWIVRQSHGMIDIETRPGGGSVVTLQFDVPSPTDESS